MDQERWRDIARGQDGLITLPQLREAGVTHRAIDFRIRTERWQRVAPAVVCITTGALTDNQRLWLGVLHGGSGALIAGVHALAAAGLKNWTRDTIAVLVPYANDVPDRLDGYRFIRSRRDLVAFKAAGCSGAPRCRVEAAALLFASRERSERTAQGILAAVVQQRLTTAPALLSCLATLTPLRRAALFRASLTEIAGGAQSVAELDVKRLCKRFGLVLPHRQVKRRDADGRLRYTDCEWRLSDGRVVVLEVDGLFHMDVGQWEDDLARQRALSGTGRIIIRCTSRELRDEPERLAADLRRLGVPSCE